MRDLLDIFIISIPIIVIFFVVLIVYVPLFMQAKKHNQILKFWNDGRPDLSLQILADPKSKRLKYYLNLRALCEAEAGNFSTAVTLQLSEIIMPPKTGDDLIKLYNLSIYYLDLHDVDNARKYLKFLIEHKPLMQVGKNPKTVEKNVKSLEMNIKCLKSQLCYAENDDQASLFQVIEHLGELVSETKSTPRLQCSINLVKAKYEWKYGSKEEAEQLYQGIISSGTTAWYKNAAVEALELLKQGLPPKEIILKTR